VGVELTVLTPESGRAEESVEGEFEGDDLIVASIRVTCWTAWTQFDPHSDLGGKRSGQTGSRASEGEDEYRYLLMPVKVS